MVVSSCRSGFTPRSHETASLQSRRKAAPTFESRLSCRSLLAEREGIKRSVVLPGVKVRKLGARVAETSSQPESRAIPGVLWSALLQ